MSGIPERLKTALADRYGIERELGQGGMATVYLAEDLKHRRKVALKVLRPELAAVLGAERFVQEITTTAALQHPHILPLFDSGTAGQQDGGTAFLYYVMPYIEGETLRDKLDRETQLSIEEAVKITTEVADALDYAHRHGVIHRDIKPENILLHDGRPMVADFGIALAVSAAAGGRMTETGMSLGTPHYMSPEQATADKDISNRSDIYALGSVLYEMLTGDPPHTASSAQAIIMKIIAEPVQPVTERRKSVPPNVAAAVAKSLEKLPADRFDSAKAFAEALANPGFTSAAIAGGSVVVSSSRRPVAIPVLAASVMLVLALIVGVALGYWVGKPATPTLRPIRAELEPPLGTEYWEQQFAALSPNGRRLAFVTIGSVGERQIWIRDLETGALDAFPTTRGAEAPFWSPTGRALGYFKQRALWRIEVDGRAERQLCDHADVGGAWSNENVILFTNQGHPMMVPGDGGACDAVPGGWADSGLTVWRPTWFPDGRRFAVEALVSGTAAAGWEIVYGSVDGDPPRRLLEGKDPSLVAPDLLVFSRPGSGSGPDIVAQRVDLETVTPLGAAVTLAQGVRGSGQTASYTVAASSMVYLPTPPMGVDQGPLLLDVSGTLHDTVGVQGTWTWRFSGDGARVAMAGAGMWVYDTERRTSVAVRRSGFYTFPVWAPGDSLLAATDIGGGGCVSSQFGKIVLARPESGVDTTLSDLFADVGCTYTSDWTADGRLLVLTGPGELDRGSSVWTYNLATGHGQRVLSVDGAASAAVVSPDMQWMAYVSDETGELQVYVRPFQGSGRTVRVSPAGGALPRWRHDGRALFYEAPNGTVWRVVVRPGTTLDVGDPELLFRAPRWSARLWTDQTRGVLTSTPYDVSPNGQRFLVRPPNQETPNAVLLLNWQSLLDGTQGGR